MGAVDVIFSNAQEIRMGSPHKVCDIAMSGSWVPELPDEDWQDVTAESPERRFRVLIAWSVNTGNEPGFKAYVIDTEAQEFFPLKGISGCCRRAEWDADQQSFKFEVARQGKIEEVFGKPIGGADG